MMNRPSRRMRGLPVLAALALSALLGACDSPTDTRTVQELAVVLNSVGRSLSVFPVIGEGEPYTIGLGSQGSPTTMALRGRVAVVPMGTYPFAAVVNLVDRQVDFVALPEGSGATGVAFVNDSIAVVANSSLNTVTPVNVLRRTTGAQVAVGRFPQAVVAGGGNVFVINGELENFAPVGPGTVTVLSEGLQPVGTATLTGQNPGAGAFLAGRLYVAEAGSFGVQDGGMAVVATNPVREVSHFTGLGDFPGSVAGGPTGLVYVGVYDEGLAIYNAGTARFVRGGDSGQPYVLKDEAARVSGVAVHPTGAVYALDARDCAGRGFIYRLSPLGEVVARAETGVCPFAVGLTGFFVED